VRADDTPAILAVLNADKKRLELLELEKTLTVEFENGNADAGAKLKEVSGSSIVCKHELMLKLVDCRAGVDNWGPQGHLWPFAHFSVALLMLTISKICHFYSG